jgi:hypothetical protein
MVDVPGVPVPDTSAVAPADAAAVAAPPVAPVESAPAPAVTETAVAPHTDTPSLLETVAAPGDVLAAPAVVEPAKPDAATPAPDDAAKPPADAAPVIPAPVLEPITYAFEFPANLKADDPKIAEYTSILGEARIAPEVGQKILNMYGEAAQAYTAHIASEQHRIFGETRANWRKEILADPEFGGAGHETSSGAIARMRDQFVPEKDQAAFNEMLRVTGAGDHPAFWRMLYRVANAFDEPSSSPPVGKPPADIGVRPGRQARRDALYDNPRSHPNGRG